MAVLCGGSSGATVALDQGQDNCADRLIAVQRQEGKVYDWTSDDGAALAKRVGAETAELDFGVNVHDDGETYGTNQLTSAAAPFEASMVGLTFSIAGFGKRVIEVFNGAGDIEFSGAPIAAQTGLRFTVPVGRVTFSDGETGSDAGLASVLTGTPDNKLYSASAPFNATHVGTKTSINGVGTRVITSFTNANEVVVDGAAFGPGTNVFFTLSSDIEPADRVLKSGTSLVVDSHRTPRFQASVVLRWVVCPTDR